MEAPTLLSQRGFAYVVRYQQTPGRGEGRNIAVALVAEDGRYGAVKHLPPSQLSDRLRERGIVDNALVTLARLVAANSDGVERLERIRSAGQGTLTIGDPLPTDISTTPDGVLSALFRALVARPTRRRRGRTKAEVLDQAIATFRRVGAPVRVGQYVGDFLLDAVVDPIDQPGMVMHAQSFEGARKDWGRIEQEAGHFLFAVERIHRDAVCVLQPPQQDATDGALAAYARVGRWCSDTGVLVASAPSLTAIAARYEGREQLPLFMST